MSKIQALARKWRPKNFLELVGQDHVVKALTNAFEQKRLHHAYLFTGTRGVGKTTIARILAKALNCDTGITATPCGICSACVEIDSGRFVDLIELDAASNTQVDNMRELLENARYAPTCARYKVYIIDEVHMLSKSAFNAMLKTLEEPPEHVKFVLATTDPQKIPVTVLSRCLQFNLKQITLPLISSHLKKILEKEVIGYDVASLQLLARAAQGSMRDALSMVDQAIIFGNGEIHEAEVRDMLSVIDQNYLYDLLDALAQKNGKQMLSIANAMEVRSLSFDAVLHDLSGLLHRLALAHIVPETVDEVMPERERIFALIRIFTSEDIQLFYQIVLHGRDDLGLAPDEYAGFTMTLMRMLAFVPTNASIDTSISYRALDKPEEAKSLLSDKKNNKLDADVAPSAIETMTMEKMDFSADQFNGQWLAIIDNLKLNGMAKMLAQNCEIKNFATDKIELCISEIHKHLLEKTYKEKIKIALDDYFGKPIQLKFSIGGGVGATPAEIKDSIKKTKLSNAISAIETDLFVRELIDNFDAKLIVSSIKPIE